MIVACASCQTRFRVADEKLGPQGARVRCTRCGVVFTAVAPAAVVAADPVSSTPRTEGSDAEGWPTGSLEQARRQESEAPSSPGRPLHDDPFAAFATAPLTLEERTAAVPLARAANPHSASAPPPADGYQELDLGGTTAVDGFEVVGPGAAVPEGALDDAPIVKSAAGPAGTPLTGPTGVSPAASPAVSPAASADAAAAPRTAPQARPRARLGRALAMNVLSLAALLVVTLGIVVAWRGGGLAGLLPSRGAGPAGLQAIPRASGVYEGASGFRMAFVRGEVRAGRGPVEGRVAVRVVFERGNARLGVAESLAGFDPGPTELAAVASAADLDALRRSAAGRAPSRLDAGATAPFLAAVALPAGGEDDLRFRIESVTEAGR